MNNENKIRKYQLLSNKSERENINICQLSSLPLENRDNKAKLIDYQLSIIHW